MTTPGERAALSLIVAWIALGLAVDTRRHRTDNSLDTFFTSAHALLYAGWVAAAVYLLWRTRRRGGVPHGLELAAGAAAVFAFGAVGDAIWHIRFGIEVELKILFSPTHLFLMVAMLLLSSGPVRAAWRSTDLGPAPHLRGFWPVALATGALTSVLIVFTQFASPFEAPVFTTVVPDLFGAREAVQLQGIVSVLIATVVLFAPLLLLDRRWTVPFGTGLIAFAFVASCIWIYHDFRRPRLCIALVLGGLLGDLLRLVLRATVTPRRTLRISGALGPLLLWGAYLLLTARNRAITWPAEQWTGTLVWTALIGVGVTVLLLPPSIPRGVAGSPIDATDESLHLHDDLDAALPPPDEGSIGPVRSAG